MNECLVARERSQGGFTLPELLVALAIIAAAVAIAFPLSGSASTSAALRASAHDLVAAARLARISAMQSGHSNALILDQQSGTYWVPGVVPPRSLKGPFRLELSEGRANRRLAADRIVFEPDGTSSGGTVTLITRGQRIAIDVDWVAGSARVR